MSEIYKNAVRAVKIAKSAKCYICKEKTVGIIADGYRIHFVCKTHLMLDEQRRKSTQI